MTASPSRGLYDLLTSKIAPYAAEGGTIAFDRLAHAPVDDETVGLIAECLRSEDRDERCAALFVFAGLQDDTPTRLEPFRPLEPKIRELLLDTEPSVRRDALMAFAYFDPADLQVAVKEFLTDPFGQNRLQAVHILDAERNPASLPTLLTLGVDPYHEAADDTREWLVVREAARQAIEHVGNLHFPEELDEENVEGVSCVYHVWDPVWAWAVKAKIGKG